MAALADGVRIHIQQSFAEALSAAFRVAVPIMALGLLLVVLLPARRIREQLAVPPDEVALADTVVHGL